MFHPRPANWFDVMVPQSALACALEALAGLRAVELEADKPLMDAPLDLSALRADLEAYAELARPYRAYWPAPDRSTGLASCSPLNLLHTTIYDVRTWIEDAKPHIDDLQRATRQEADLAHVRDFAAAVGEDFPMSLLSERRGALFDMALFLLDDGHLPEHSPTSVIVLDFDTPVGVYVAAIGEPQGMAKLRAELGLAKAREIYVPEINASSPGELTILISQRIEALQTEQSLARAELALLSDRHAIAQARANIERLRWLADHVGDTANTALFARITGWCASEQSDVERALDSAGIEYVVSFGDAPKGLRAPMLFDNPPWARPFEVFVRMLGMPARTEADPSALVALIAPLLFGFMFGDVGQGAVLLIAGLLLRRKWPAAAILVPGGAFAILFGFAFGSVFAMEGLIGALWLHPLATPVPLLAVALGAGVAILLTGLALNGAGAHWRGAGSNWWRTDAGLVLAYVGVLLSFADNRGLMLTVLGALWFLAGSAFQGLSAIGPAVGALVENMFQLLINTLSFVRVGAFAIAHAGLSSALVVLAEISGDGFAFVLILVIGNIFIIALEGLVAGIQTTRLMLFEFFIRFLRAEGRPLRVLPTPADWSVKLEGKST